MSQNAYVDQSSIHENGPMFIMKFYVACYALLELNVSSYTLLIADDQPNMRIPLEYLLRRGPNIRLYSASDGEQAMTIAQTHRPDLALLDIALPGIDGYALCGAIRAMWNPQPPIVWLTSPHRSPYEYHQSRQAGAACLLFKPYDPDALRRDIHAALSAGHLGEQWRVRPEPSQNRCA